MATRTIVSCDWSDAKTGKACGKDVTDEGGSVSFTTENKRFAADLCVEHLKVLRPHAHEASPPIDRSNVTRLPRVTGGSTRKPQEQLIPDALDRKEARKWALAQGMITEGTKRLSAEVQQKWLDAGSPVEVADGTFKSSN